jgi:hypothetical protein
MKARITHVNTVPQQIIVSFLVLQRGHAALVIIASLQPVAGDKKAGKRPAPSFLRQFLFLRRRPADRQGRKPLISRNRSQHPSLSFKNQ